ncbi:uncharacterized protein LOC124923949 isoform X2 [Impatiens glandulifera]|uniref:uncharacterized protein LOC124923949 isoform X1 n=1 Tax=Impatiens glandulifera TaxID=253017 RepID=UPI001FB09D54|nr:uncharacterized protein LOC124923949 isoform X1 [Impatiens glandulifera]XP_047319914.1 uncharacterized protein LOC124923949 isoform X2 [Impatiens glandulifera]
MTRFCNCGTPVCIDLKCQKTKVLSKGPCKARDRVMVDGIETQTSNMLGTVGVKLTNFVNPELRWKTATKGFRTSRKGTRVWANRVLVDSRSPHRDWSSVSESEKHGVAVLGQRFANKVQHVPFKKRRLPARNQFPSLKPKLNKTRHGKGASGQCCSADLDCLPEEVTFDDKIVAVFGPKGVDNSLTNGKPCKSMCGKNHLDFSGIALLAAIACSSMINDIGHAKEESIADQSSTAKITDTVVSVSSVDAVLKEPVTSVDAVLKEPVTSVDAVDEFVENPSPEQKPSDAQDIPTAELQKASDVSDREVINQSATVKYDRLHWDLNTEMEAWEQPFDDGLSFPDGGSHSERLQKTEGSDMCGDPEHSPVPLGQYPVDNDIILGRSCPSTEILETRSCNSVMQTREEYSLHDVCSGLLIEGKVTSVEGVNLEENFRELSHFPDIHRTETCQTVNVEHSTNKLGIMNSSCESLEQGGNLCLLGTTGGEMQLGHAVNVLSQENLVDATPDASPIVSLQSNKSPDKSTLSSLISNVENGCMAVNGRMSEAQTGYESSFEDGELREDCILYLGEENEVEIDSLDYGDDGEVEHNASNFFPPKSSSPECQNMRKGNSPESAVQDGICDDMVGLTPSASSNTKQQSGRDLQLPEGCEASSGRSVATNAVSSSDGKASCAAESVPKASGGKKLFPHLEGPSRSDVIHWKDAVYAKQTGSSNLDEASALALEERDAGSDKCFRRVILPDRDHKNDDCVGSSASYWDSRNNHYLTSYHHPQETDDYSRLNDEKPRGLNYHGQRQPISYSSKCVFLKRSPRNDSRSRSRGSRPSIVGQGFTRSTRNDFPCAAPDDLASDNHSLFSARMVHSIPQREQHCISPVPLRGTNFSRNHRKFRSRSRTRSPPVWNFPRERYVGVKHRSRSPDLRFEARMERTRLPFTKSSFTSDEEDNFLPSGGKLFSKYHSKWNDSRNDDSDRISSRSPGRMFKRNQRFNWVDSMGRTKFDEQFGGGMVRSGRFTDMTGRGSKYESCDDDRRKHTDKNGMVHRFRRYDTNGFVKRARNDAEDFEAYNIHDENKYIRSRDDRREIIRSTREERGSFRCSSGRTYTSGPKFSAIPDSYVDVSPRKR